MQTQSIDIKTSDGNCDAFVAYSEEGRQFPAVVLFMDAFGPRPYLHEMAKKLAARDYYVLLPNMFYRRKRAPVVDAQFPISPEAMPAAREQIMALFKTFTPDLGMRDAAAFLDFLSKQRQVRQDKVGVTGYCMGGGLALRTAANFPDRVAAAASFHGGNLATEASDSPHRLLGKVKAELYIAHADNDKSMPAEQIERLRVALENAGVKYEAELYAGATHGFTMADLPAYHAPSLQRHWEKLFELFERTLND